MKKKFYFPAIFVFVILFFLSCGGGGGGAADPTSIAKKIWEEKASKESQGYLKVVNFLKKDAVSEKRNGVDYYILTCSFEVEGIKDEGYLCKQDVDSPNDCIYKFEVSNKLYGCFTIPIQKGKKYTIFCYNGSNKMTLAKHENGWVQVSE